MSFLWLIKVYVFDEIGCIEMFLIFKFTHGRPLTLWKVFGQCLWCSLNKKKLPQFPESDIVEWKQIFLKCFHVKHDNQIISLRYYNFFGIILVLENIPFRKTLMNALIKSVEWFFEIMLKIFDESNKPYTKCCHNMRKI